MKIWRSVAYNGCILETNAELQGRVNLWIELVNRNIYNPSVFGCCRRAFAGLECSEGGGAYISTVKYIYIVIPMSLRAGWLFLGHKGGLGLEWEVGMVADPRNRSVGNPTLGQVGGGVRKKYSGNKSKPPSRSIIAQWPFQFVKFPIAGQIPMWPNSTNRSLVKTLWVKHKNIGLNSARLACVWYCKREVLQRKDKSLVARVLSLEEGPWNSL